PISLEHGEMILHHMARNAKDHDATTLSLSLEQNILTIRDDGTGIPDENTGQITDPFFTTRRDKGGTGMGLAIVVAILEIYSARLDVMSAVQGARFQICFDTEHMP
ncbi:MAG: ATP-binding protein, partial [Pseudomonadota bacterium]